MCKTVTPRVDIAFKKLFGVEENKDLLISLINSIVSEKDQVLNIQLLNPYNPQNFKGDKLSILDIKAIAHTGKQYNIEIQIADQGDYDKRALYYWGKLYAQQLGEGNGFSKLNKTIGIHILNFTSIFDTEEYHNVFSLYNPKNNVHHFKDMELHTIELCKFENNQTNEQLNEEDQLKLLLSKVKTSLDRWVAFLTRYDLLSNKKLPKAFEDPQVEKALEVLEVMSFSKEERDSYEDHLKWMRDQLGALEKKEREGLAMGIGIGEQQGIVKGIEIGERQGIQKGRAEGIQLGEQQGIEKFRIVMIESLLAQGVDIDTIAKSLKLNANDIQNLQLVNPEI